MKQQLVADLLASERTLGEIVRDFAQAVVAQERAAAEAKQRAEDAAFDQACAELRAWLSGYLPGIWATLAGEGEVAFIRYKGSALPPPVTFFVGDTHLKLVQISPTGVIEVGAPSGVSRRLAFELGFEANTQRNWLRFVELLADLTGELPK